MKTWNFGSGCTVPSLGSGISPRIPYPSPYRDTKKVTFTTKPKCIQQSNACELLSILGSLRDQQGGHGSFLWLQRPEYGPLEEPMFTNYMGSTDCSSCIVRGLWFSISGGDSIPQPLNSQKIMIPDPWEDLESRTPLRVPRNYPIVV